MGLDMYLRLRKAHDWHSNSEWYTSYDNAWGCKWRLSESTYTVCEWRKANAIHKWFVDHVQDGEDDCGRYPVSVDKLKDLRAACREAMTLYDEGNIEDAASSCLRRMVSSSGLRTMTTTIVRISSGHLMPATT